MCTIPLMSSDDLLTIPDFLRNQKNLAAEKKQQAETSTDEGQSLSTAGLGAWIPLNKKTPEQGAAVLAFWPPKIGFMTGAKNFGVAIYAASSHWHNPEDDEDDYCEPTHWMPLPEAPNGLITSGVKKTDQSTD